MLQTTSDNPAAARALLPPAPAHLRGLAAGYNPELQLHLPSHPGARHDQLQSHQLQQQQLHPPPNPARMHLPSHPVLQQQQYLPQPLLPSAIGQGQGSASAHASGPLRPPTIAHLQGSTHYIPGLYMGNPSHAFQQQQQQQQQRHVVADGTAVLRSMGARGVPMLSDFTSLPQLWERLVVRNPATGGPSMVEQEAAGSAWRKGVDRQRWQEYKNFHKAVMGAAAAAGPVQTPEEVVRRLEMLRVGTVPGVVQYPVAAFVKKIKQHIQNV
jgi:hypothetical protein